MKIDINELEKQRRETILKSGEYVKFEVIVPSGEEALKPITNFECNKVGLDEVAIAINTIKEATKFIAKQYPEAELFSKLFLGIKSAEISDATSSNIVDIDESEG